MGALVGVGAGVGLILVWSAFYLPRRLPRPVRSASRLSALLATGLAPVVGGRPQAALRAWRRDGSKHPSPNAGPVEAAFAGALGRTLGGRLAYAARIEDRPFLGDGPAPEVGDIARAARLSGAVTVAAGALAVGVRLLLDRR